MFHEQDDVEKKHTHWMTRQYFFSNSYNGYNKVFLYVFSEVLTAVAKSREKVILLQI